MYESITPSIKISYKLMGILSAHTGAIWCIVMHILSWFEVHMHEAGLHWSATDCSSTVGDGSDSMGLSMWIL